MKANPFFIWKVTEDSRDMIRSPSESLTIKSKSSEISVFLPKHSTKFLREENDEEKQVDDLFQHLRFFFIVGRLFGIIPFSGVFTRPPSCKKLYFHPKKPAALISMTVLAVLTVNLIFGVLHMIHHRSKRNAYEIAKSFGANIQFFWAWLIFFNFIFRGKKLLSLLYCWSKTTVFYGIPDRHLKRDVILITMLIMTSAFLENGILHLEYFPALDFISGSKVANETTSLSPLESYYYKSHEHWAKFLGYNEIFAVIAFIQHKCILYGWNYMDIMIAVFSRAMYFKFKMLYKLATEKLVKPLRKGQNGDNHHHDSSMQSINENKWEQIAYDHKRLCFLLDQMENFLSPLIFGSYAVNIFYICIQLLDGLTIDSSKTTLVHSIYTPWSFLHIIMRLYILSICAARVNSYAHKIREVIQECPIDQYNDEISRLDKKVTTGPLLGFSGLDCFVVTKPFLLQIISVVFTFEIVLLQGAPSSGDSSSSTSC